MAEDRAYIEGRLVMDSKQDLVDEINRLKIRENEHQERYDALEAKAEFHRQEVGRLRRALKFYAEATAADFGNDNGFNAEAALAE